MDLYLSAAVLGLSFGNLWICVLLVFSLQTSNRATAAGYLAGRAGALVALCLVVALLGRAVHLPHASLHVATGGLLLGFSAYLLALHVFGWVPPWKRPATGHDDPAGANCDHHCASCALRGDPVAHAACGDCGDHGVCSAEEPEVRDLTVSARRAHGKPTDDGSGGGDAPVAGFWPGVTLGALRGAAMCGKLVVLLPLLLPAAWHEALGVGLVFAATSSIYPLLGFAFGRFALRLVPLKKPLFWFSSLFLGGLGGRMIWMAL
jgi:hypothetical protein